MKNKVLIISVLIVLVLASAVFLPTDKFKLSNLLSFGKGEKYAALEVYSLGGDMKVFLDGKEEGLVQETEGNFELSPIKAGKHKVKLERVSTSAGFYENFEKELDFVEGFTVVVSWEIGPTEELSSGWILTAKKAVNSEGKTKLNFLSNSEDMTIDLNGKSNLMPVVGLEYPLNEKLLVSVHSPSSQSLTFDLFPEDQNQRDKLNNYELFIYVDLFKLPIENVAQR